MLWNLFCAASGTSAYLTDHEERIKQITAGYNETGTEEEFPTPTPTAPGETIVKKVRVQNRGAVPCYIRISLAVSEGSVSLEGLNTTEWTNGKDGYYYYRNVVEPGGSTEDLFAGVRIGGNPEADSVTVTVYEESVQAFDGTVHGNITGEVAAHEKKKMDRGRNHQRLFGWRVRDICLLSGYGFRAELHFNRRYQYRDSGV